MWRRDFHASLAQRLELAALAARVLGLELVRVQREDVADAGDLMVTRERLGRPLGAGAAQREDVAGADAVQVVGVEPVALGRGGGRLGLFRVIVFGSCVGLVGLVGLVSGF